MYFFAGYLTYFPFLQLFVFTCCVNQSAWSTPAWNKFGQMWNYSGTEFWWRPFCLEITLILWGKSGKFLYICKYFGLNILANSSYRPLPKLLCSPTAMVHISTNQRPPLLNQSASDLKLRVVSDFQSFTDIPLMQNVKQDRVITIAWCRFNSHSVARELFLDRGTPNWWDLCSPDLDRV